MFPIFYFTFSIMKNFDKEKTKSKRLSVRKVKFATYTKTNSQNLRLFAKNQNPNSKSQKQDFKFDTEIIDNEIFYGRKMKSVNLL
jgi:hypothetical protein